MILLGLVWNSSSRAKKNSKDELASSFIFKMMKTQTMDSMIAIRNGSKKYGKGKDGQVVLKNFNMTIKKGSM